MKTVSFLQTHTHTLSECAQEPIQNPSMSDQNSLVWLSHALSHRSANDIPSHTCRYGCSAALRRVSPFQNGNVFPTVCCKTEQTSLTSLLHCDFTALLLQTQILFFLFFLSPDNFQPRHEILPYLCNALILPFLHNKFTVNKAT